MAALVEYIALFHSSNEDPSSIWPTFKNEEFWGKCADAVNCYNSDKKRTGKLNLKKMNIKFIMVFTVSNPF
jgi:hypothetical protein